MCCLLQKTAYETRISDRSADVCSSDLRFFSHLPAWVEVSAAGSSRASANISAIACSAVVLELPNGVFITTTPLAEAAGISTLSTPITARPTPFRLGAARAEAHTSELQPRMRIHYADLHSKNKKTTKR